MKRYTAQEMRDMADLFDYGMTAEMLRQAADDLECEKRYEYSVKYVGKVSGIEIGRETYVYGSKELAMKAGESYKGEKAVLIRRAVGEWEEVKE